jgi:hypothetical protein
LPSRGLELARLAQVGGPLELTHMTGGGVRSVAELGCGARWAIESDARLGEPVWVVPVVGGPPSAGLVAAAAAEVAFEHSREPRRCVPAPGIHQTAAAPVRSQTRAGSELVVDDDGAGEKVREAAAPLGEQHGQEPREERHDREDEPDEPHEGATD